MDKNSNGYSLIELLVVISIIILFSGLSLAAYNNFNEEKKLETETKKLIDVLNLASKKASSGDSPSSNCTYFQGYRVIIFSSPSYQLQTCCSQTWSCDEQANPLQTYNLPVNFTVTTNRGTNANILFKKLASGVVINQDTDINNVIIRICNSNINKFIPITVERSGLVNEGAKTQTCP